MDTNAMVVTKEGQQKETIVVIANNEMYVYSNTTIESRRK